MKPLKYILKLQKQKQNVLVNKLKIQTLCNKHVHVYNLNILEQNHLDLFNDGHACAHSSIVCAQEALSFDVTVLNMLLLLF